MIDKPQITQTPAQLTAIIRLAIPPSEMQKVVGPAISEVLAAVKAQHIAHAGPWFIHMLKMDAAAWDFEVGVPVVAKVVAVGRVKPGQRPAMKAARTVHHGGYEGLGAAWREFDCLGRKGRPHAGSGSLGFLCRGSGVQS